MGTFKWELLKQHALERIEVDPWSGGGNGNIIAYALIAGMHDHSKWRNNAEEMKQMAIDVVKAWDVRACMKLVDRFPSILPKKYHNKSPMLDTNDKGDWVLIFSNEE